MIHNIFVIIVTYNGAQWIERCLKSVYQSNIPAVPIIVDNNSSDNTLDIIKEKFPLCQIIETGKNLGFGKANNIGILKAFEQNAEYIYLLNQDAWVAPNVFKELITIHTTYPEYGILSPIQITADKSAIDKSFLQNTLTDCYCKNICSDILLNQCKKVYEVNFVMAAHWLIYVPYLKKVGLFSPVFPHYGEDNNLVSRFQYWGYKVGICPTLYGVHDRMYREITPKQELYFKYKWLLTEWNNPMIKSNVQRYVNLLKFIYGCSRAHKVPLANRFGTIIKGIKSLKSSTIYRRLSRKEGKLTQISNLNL